MKKILLFSALLALTIFTACNKQDLELEVVPVSEESPTLVTKNRTDHQRFDYTAEAGIADFTINHEDATLFENDVLLLTNNSANAVSYHWDFGNGHTSTEAQPTYKYQIHGYYTVTLTITDRTGKTHQASEEVLVLCVFGGGSHQN